MLIRDFLLDQGESILITYPRRWYFLYKNNELYILKRGKSLNMKMIVEFLRIEVDSNGNPLT